MDTTKSSEAMRISAAWKFEIFDTVNADPCLKPTDLKMMIAYLNYANYDKREAYLANSTARALTNIRSHTTMSESRSRLQEFGYLTDTGKRTLDGCVWFELRNSREKLVADHVRMTIEVVREREAFRKADDRRRAVAKQRQHPLVPPENGTAVTSDTGPSNLPCPSTNCRDSPPFYGDNPLELTHGNLSHRNARPVLTGDTSDRWGIYDKQLRPLSEVQADAYVVESLARLGLTLDDVAVF